MISMSKVMVVLSVGLILFLGLSTAAQTEILDRRHDVQENGKKQMDQLGSQSTGGKIIQGQVIRVEGTDCFIKDANDKELLLRMDITTLKSRNIEPGQRIEAKVNEQNKVMTILSEPTVGSSATNNRALVEPVGPPIIEIGQRVGKQKMHP